MPKTRQIIYLIFNEGYAATARDDLVRPGLCLEAQRLGRMLAALMPEDAEVLGLLALMEIQASRQNARTGPDGAFIPITEQDRARWDHLLISRGLDALARALGDGDDAEHVRLEHRSYLIERHDAQSRGRPLPSSSLCFHSAAGCCSAQVRSLSSAGQRDCPHSVR